MNLRNPFSDETRALFMYRYDCDICGRNNNLELHHIRGRCSSSPLNASVLCRACHDTMNHNWEEEKMLLNKTMTFLQSQYYKLTKADEEFLQSLGILLLDLNK